MIVSRVGGADLPKYTLESVSGQANRLYKIEVKEKTINIFDVLS